MITHALRGTHQKLQLMQPLKAQGGHIRREGQGLVLFKEAPMLFQAPLAVFPAAVR